MKIPKCDDPVCPLCSPGGRRVIRSVSAWWRRVRMIGTPVAVLIGSAIVWATCWHATTWFWVRVVGWRAW